MSVQLGEREALLNKRVLSGRLTTIKDDDYDNEAHEAPTKNQLGALNGVYVPCLLNILGAVLFMKLGYSVGYAGWIGTLVIFVFSEIVTVLTALSFSAIVTNGDMKGGGAYYMISRSIGPAFGGATGMMFYLCYVANAAFNAQAFVQDVTDTLCTDKASPYEKDGSSVWCASTSSQFMDYTYYMYHFTMFIMLVIAYGGAGAFAKVNIILFVTLITCILISFGSLIFGKENFIEHYNNSSDNGGCSFADDQIPYPINVTYHPPSSHRFHANLWPSSPDMHTQTGETVDGLKFPDFWSKMTTNNVTTVLALIFTSTCGVMEGANLSGDLKNPAQALPKGTLFAKCTSFTTYILFSTLLALTFDRQALMCEFNVVQKSNVVSPYIVVIGIAMACLSTSLGALFGAARILQAIARDEIYPISYFKKGAKKGDEPRRAVVFTWLLSNAFIYLSGTSLNDIAGLLTDFFLTAYACVNLSQFLLAISNAPNYRPTFNWTSWYTSLFAFCCSMGLMWFLNSTYAAITCITWAVIFTYVKSTAPDKDWGDVSQAILYRAVVGYLKQIVEKKDNVKFWRSSVLLLAQDVDLPLLTFCKHLTKDGLFIIGSTHVDGSRTEPDGDGPRGRKRTATLSMLPKYSNPVAVTKAVWLWVIEKANLNAMVQVGTGSNLLEVFRTMISCAGLGGLVPNTVVVPYKERHATTRTPDYVGRINEQLQVLEQSAEANSVNPKKKIKLDEEAVRGILWHPPAYNSTVNKLNSNEYVGLLQHVLDLEKNVMIVRNLGSLEPIFTLSADKLRRTGGYSNANSINNHQFAEAGTPTTGTYIDVWIVGEWDWESLEENITILLQHAHLMQQALGKMCTLRIIQLVKYFFSEEQVFFHQGLVDLVTAARIPMPELVVYPAPQSTVSPNQSRPGSRQSRRSTAGDEASVRDGLEGLNQTIKSHSADTIMTFLALPALPATINPDSSNEYIEQLDMLTADLPPLVLIKKGEPAPILSHSI